MQHLLTQLQRHAVNHPERIALICGDAHISYRSLAQKIKELKQTLGIVGGRSFAFQLDNGPDWIVNDLAAAASGLNVIPIPGFFSDQQRDHVLFDAMVDIYASSDGLSPGEDWCAPIDPLANTHGIFHRAVAAELECVDTKITYTSGSTGNPKGVVLAGETIDRVARSIVTAMSSLAIEKHLCLLPMATLLENIAGVYAPIMRGITIDCPSLADVGLSGANLDIEKFCKTLNASKPDSIILVPQLLTALVTLAEFGMLDTASLKMIAVGGGRISRHLLDRANKLNLPVFQGYGLSECCSVLTLNTPEANRLGSVGKPLPHARLRISSESEIEAQGSIMRGYLGTQIVDDAWYATGDLGYIDDDGYVFITGRQKNVFITSFGRNVNPEWVEAALTQQPAIAQALIFGEAQAHNLALLWLRFEQTDEALSQIIAQTNAELPDYAQVHEYIVVAEPIDAQLMTANGRLKREQVASRYQNEINAHYQRVSEGNDYEIL